MREILLRVVLVSIVQFFVLSLPIVQADDNAYQKYQQDFIAMQKIDREAFVKGEPALTAREQMLDDKLAAERATMKKNAMKSGDYTTYPPSQPFYKARDMIEKSQALQYFKEMPKGGNLHVHTSSTADINEFINMLASDPNVYLYWGEDTSDYIKGTLFYLEYEPKNPFFKNLKEAFAREEITSKDLKQLLTVSDDSADTIPYIWDDFNAIFSRVSPVLKTKKIYEEYYRSSFQTMLQDNLDYVELRFGPQKLVDSNDLMLAEKDRGDLPTDFNVHEGTQEESIQTIHRIWKSVQETSPDFTLKLIISKSRGTDADTILAFMKKVQQWRKDPNLFSKENFIVGFDLVSEEDRNNTTDYYAKTILENNIDLPFYFHDGETSWADNDNLYAAYLLKTKRIGHGFSIYRYPSLERKVQDAKICLEICPISNQLLRYTQDLRMHPMGEFLNDNVLFVICSDDPQIFADTGLSYDFWELYFSQDVDLRTIKKLIKNSYQYSAMTDEEKDKALKRWQGKWDKFIAEVKL